jgi:hypothetical protein
MSVTVSPSPEFALLLDAIAPASSARVDHRRWDATDWERALRAARWHRLSPILFCHLRCADGVPDTVLESLERAYLENAARNLFVASAIARIVEALAAAHIPVMLLKGAALLGTVYAEDPARRELLDIDVLVPADRLAAANAALGGLGYRPAPGEGEAPTDLAGRLEHQHDPALVGSEGVVAVELHHHLTTAGEGLRFDIGEVWDRAHPAEGDGRHLMPGAEDLLMHVCFHFTRNRLGGSARRRGTGGALAQLADVAGILEREEIDWDAMAESARRRRLDARVFLALFAAHELGIPVAPAGLEALRPPGFDPALGRRLVSLRVLRGDDRLPVRSLRWMLAPGSEVLSNGWEGESGEPLSLARAYLRRAKANAPLARAALRRPRAVLEDRRLNGEIHALEHRA